MASFNPHKIANKQKRQSHNLKTKKQKESSKRDERLRRRRTEDKNPRLREERRAKNVPLTIDKKRTWDEATADDEAEGALGLSVDVLHTKRQRVEEAVVGLDDEDGVLDNEDEADAGDDAEEDDLDSMLGSSSDSEVSVDEVNAEAQPTTDPPPPRAPSETPSTATTTATDLALTPSALLTRFPTLFNPPTPKVLITTSLQTPLHHEATLLTRLFPNSQYIRRTAHAHSHKYSVREISAYASARGYTTLIILNSGRKKKPTGLDFVHLPSGPMFHFSLSNWVEGGKIPGHGNPTNHYPELILNGFRTPLGLLTAHLFKSLFPPHPEVQGRQVVTAHNQRDYIFLRRHRYVFREKRASEKSLQGADGKLVEGVEGIRAGLQELGPRFTLKLRRVDKGVQGASGLEWKWRAGDEKVRTRFSL